jgi:PAS domain-containing protein
VTLMQLPDLPKGVRPLVKPIVDTADAAFVMSLDCQFLAWGSRAQQLFGFSPPDVLGRYCYDVLPARDASGQCLCSVNCPMVVAARYGYSVPPSEACIRTKQNRAIWVRLSPIVLRAPHGAICEGGSAGCFDPNRSRAPTAIASLHQFGRTQLIILKKSGGSRCWNARKNTC